MPHLDFDLIEAGRARHELDWIYGVNLSRALTISARNWSGRYATLSTGRVQGPTLKFLVSREKIIRSFVPTPYWEIKAKVEIEGLVFETEFEKKKIEAEKEALAVLDACEKKNGQIEKIDIRRFKQKPPVPFNSGGLQSEAYGLFGYTPRRTSDIAQRLYLDALISYPRTSSQRLPRGINYRQILVNLSKIAEYRNLAEELLSKSKLKPQEGRKEDPAHPAIYPTGKTPERILSNPENKILDLITRRFMAVFGEPATKLIVKAHINVADHRFFLKGRQTLKKSWLRFYAPYATSEEVILPTIREGKQVKVTRVFLEDKFTRPPSRYNPGSLLRKMEKSGIGTKVTRAGIIQTLYDRKYIQGKRMEVTDLGLEVLDVLEKYCPNVVSVRMTSRLQIKMDEIQVNREKRQNVLIDAVEMVKPVMTRLKEKEEVIGERLSRAIRISKLEERIVGVCPVCETGNLMILYSRKSKKRFIGCTSYFEGRCNTSFPLPQRGSVRPLKGNCPKCGWPIVQVWLRSKHPWTLCFNSDCPSKKNGKTKR